MPFAVGLNWLRVDLKFRFCDGSSVRTENFMEQIFFFFASLQLVKVADIMAQNVAVSDVASSRLCKSGDLLS
jgi:hypothetical protein